MTATKLKSFVRASLAGSDFSGKTLENIDFSYADLSGADFSKATLRDVCFIGARLSLASFSAAILEDVDFSGADLGGVNGYLMNCRRSVFNRTVLVGANFTEARLQGEFRGSNMSRSILSGAVVDNCVFEGAHLACSDGMGLKAYLSDFSGAELSYCNFSGGKFSESNLDRANLHFATFDDTQLTASTFNLANLSNASFHRATFLQVEMRQSKLSFASLVDCSLHHPDFRGADFSEAEMDEKTRSAILESGYWGGSVGKAFPFKGVVETQTVWDLKKLFEQSDDDVREWEIAELKRQINEAEAALAAEKLAAEKLAAEKRSVKKTPSKGDES